MLLEMGPRHAYVGMLSTLQLDLLPDTEAGCSVGQPAGCTMSTWRLLGSFWFWWDRPVAFAGSDPSPACNSSHSFALYHLLHPGCCHPVFAWLLLEWWSAPSVLALTWWCTSWTTSAPLAISRLLGAAEADFQIAPTPAP